MDWIYNEQPFTTAPEDAFGFVYLITNTHTGQKYIGKKQFWSLLTKKVEGRKNRVHYKKESDWKKYWSSCGELKEDFQCLGESAFSREIVTIYSTKGELTFGEMEHQIKNDVLKAKMLDGRPAFYNRNILNKFFVRPDVVSEETRRRMSDSFRGRVVTEETRAKISATLTGVSKPPRTEEHCQHMSEAKMGTEPWNKGLQTGVGGPKGVSKSPEQRAKISETLKAKGIEPITCRLRGAERAKYS
jgi:hypothetical protein